ncbi:MAG TPA: LamG-like jellyroll fold domain-containing protein [Pyrinomonadaceae bacterium]|jgi:lysophospholipase L1-like esterase|nr:LamG-like jellyroll fold domain-containing protein [Pyrinomonadaceae bacterium]
MLYARILILLVLVSGNVWANEPITIYLAGDSTMAQKLPEKRPETGWGEALQKSFPEDKVRIENHAQNGRSTRTFIAEKRWQAIVDKLKKGDYVFIQFGHNDESKEKVDRYTPPEDYCRNLLKFISEVREKQAIPILLTPVMRRRFDDKGNFFDTHGEYPDIVRAVAAEHKVLLIDMHRDSERLIKQYGVAASRKLFLQLAPGENPNYPKGIEDNTHFSPLGAGLMAGLVVDAIRKQKLGLAKELKPQPPSVAWDVSSLKKIGGQPATMNGNPQVIKTANGKAVLFDGKDDGLVVNVNPLAGATAFTLEAVFRPDSGGTTEQRWFHVQESANDNRILLEIRLTGDEWFLDSFIKSGEEKRTLYSENFKHKTGEWYHVALVYDGVTMRHFVDGKEELSGPLAIQPLGSGSTSIGVRMNRVFWFKGAVRKARFTPRALSPSEFMGRK